MTQKKALRSMKNYLEQLRSGQLLFGLFVLFCLLLILRNTEIAMESMSRGLALCAKTVIPSLFPFMVISEMIVLGGFGGAVIKRLCAPLCRLLRLNPDGCCAALLGILCGFPIGVRSATLSYEEGRITKRDAERILCFSSNPSSAFLVSAVGASLWGNVKFGIALYASVLLSAILIGIFLAQIASDPPCKEIPKHGSHSTSARPSPPQLFCQSIRSALGSILLVCAYVVFFSALVGTFNFMPGVQKLPSSAQAFLFCFFELSCGMSQAAALSSPHIAAMLCAFAAGWSGVSVHCQALSLCEKSRLSLRPYLFAKAAQAILTPLLLGILIGLFPNLLIPATLG